MCIYIYMLNNIYPGILLMWSRQGDRPLSARLRARHVSRALLRGRPARSLAAKHRIRGLAG